MRDTENRPFVGESLRAAVQRPSSGAQRASGGTTGATPDLHRPRAPRALSGYRGGAETRRRGDFSSSGGHAIAATPDLNRACTERWAAIASGIAAAVVLLACVFDAPYWLAVALQAWGAP